MARKLRWIALALLVLAAASLLALYSYGRFAERVRGAPSQALALAPAATPLDRAIAPLTEARPQQSGVLLLSDNLDAFAVRAGVTRAAGRSLDLQYYIWHHDLTGNLLSHELLGAADRGVRVRLLLDDLNAHGRDSVLAALDRHPNIEVRLFNPSRSRTGTLARAVEMVLRLVSMNRRMHNKAWIADGRVAVVGGRNVGDEYFDAAADTNFLDMDVVLLGPAVQQTERIFDGFWNSASVIPLEALRRSEPQALDQLRRHGDAGRQAEQAKPYVQRLLQDSSVFALGRNAGPLRWSSKVQVYSDPAEKGQGGGKQDWLTVTLGPVMAKAQRELRLISPYFVPGEQGLRWLQGMRQRGVDVAVLTNSLAANDVVAVHGGYAPYRKPLLRAGVELFELMPHGERNSSLFGSSGASLHTKAFAVDGDVGFIGSFNMDPRSVSLNTEMGVVFEDAALTSELLQSYAEKTSAKRSYRVILQQDELRWVDGSVDPARTWTHEPEAGLWRRGMARVIGWLPIESQL